MFNMAETRRILVCGSGVALSGIETSLSLDPGCEVLSHALPISCEELRYLAPDVVLFDLDAVPPSFLYTTSRTLQGALLIGIDLETNRALLWTGQQAEGLRSQDLVEVIRGSGQALSDTNVNQ
jgi:hypothetical protein